MHIRHLIQFFSTVWILISLIIVNVAIYYLFYNVTIDREMEQISRHTKEIVKNVSPHLNELERAALLRAYVPDDGMIRVIDSNNNVLVTVTQNPDLRTLRVTPQQTEHVSVETFQEETFLSAYFPMIWENGEIATVEVRENLAPAIANLQTLKLVLFAASLLILIPTFVGGHLLSKLILKPIQTMIRTMEEIQSKGTFKQIPIGKRPKDELFQMATTFNNMIGMLEKNFNKQQQFVQDASHELKTPLTIIESYANMLKRWGMERQDIVQESVDAISSEAKRMREMTEQMLLLAKNDEEWNLELTQFNLEALCRETGERFEKVYGRTITILSDGSSPSLYANREKVKQLLFILLDNAYKYSSQAIEIFVGKTNNDIYFSVRDEGIGIPKDEQAYLFDRFYRVDEARNRKTGGTGLGLAIAYQIVKAHKGKIHIESEENKGTEVIVTFSHKFNQ